MCPRRLIIDKAKLEERFKSWPMFWGSSLSLLTMKVYAALLLSASSLFNTAMGRNFTVNNACSFTIWYVSTFTSKPRQYFFRPAVGICFGIE